MVLKGRVLSFIGGLLSIEKLDSNEIVAFKPQGIFRHHKHVLKPLPGDYVYLSQENDQYIIDKIEARKNELIRPRVVNVDEIVLVQSVVQPDLNLTLLLKYLAFYEIYVNKVKIAFTKVDLLSTEQYKNFLEVYQMLMHDGYSCFKTNDADDFLNLKNEIENNTVCLVGNSGVGKSTLLNKIDPELYLKTQEISLALNRGKHTTTNVILIKYHKGYLIDTPGFSSLNIDFKPEILAQAWHDFYKLHTKCKFANCLHRNENGCEIKKAVTDGTISKIRYEIYLNLLDEIINKK